MLAHEQQRVAQLEVVDGRRRRADIRILHHRTAHEPALPPGGFPSQREIGFFAIREVALVEDADLFEARASREHERAVRVSCGLPSLAHRGGREDAAEIGVDDRGGAVAYVGARQPGTRSFTEHREHVADACRLGKGVVWREHHPVALVDDPQFGRKAVDKVPVMRHEQQCPGEAGQHPLQCITRGNVEVIGRLVQYQDI